MRPSPLGRGNSIVSGEHEWLDKMYENDPLFQVIMGRPRLGSIGKMNTGQIAALLLPLLMNKGGLFGKRK